MQASPRRDRQAIQDDRDLCRRQAFPLGQQQNLTILRAQAAKRLTHQRFLFRGLRRNGRRLDGQTLLQRDAAAVRPALVRENLARRRVEPHARCFTFGHLIEPAPGRQKHLGNRVLCVGCPIGSPAAVRDHVRAVRREQGIETSVSLVWAFPHTRNLLLD